MVSLSADKLPKAETIGAFLHEKMNANFRIRFLSAVADELARPVQDPREIPRLDAGNLVKVLSLHPEFLQVPVRPETPPEPWSTVGASKIITRR
jgi:hypothetical protein